MEFFAYYAHWTPNFSSKLSSLTVSSTFPLGEKAVKTFKDLSVDIAKSVVTAIDETNPFALKTDASEIAMAATLNQSGRSVAFFSRLAKVVKRITSQSRRKH